jgi:exonuclease VII large subunit
MEGPDPSAAAELVLPREEELGKNIRVAQTDLRTLL